MRMKMEIGTCPLCGGELIVEKILDTEHCGGDCVITVEGYCEKCQKQFQWEDVFELSFSRNIEEIKPIHYWVGTMNRVCSTFGDDKPVLDWEEKKSEWCEVDEKEYQEAYNEAWNIAVNGNWG